MRPTFANTAPSYLQHLRNISIYECPIRIAFTTAGGSASGVTNPATLVGVLSNIFLYLRTVGRTLLSNNHARLQLDRPPKKAPRPVPAGPIDRFALVGTQLWKVFPRHRACVDPAPPSPPSANGRGKTRTTNSDST